LKRIAILLIALVALALPAEPAVAASRIAVSDAWSRPAIGTGVVYARIANGDGRPDRLDAIRTPLAATVEIHKSMSSTMQMNGMTMNGVMSMEQVPSLTIPARGSVTLNPGGYHLMLIRLRRDLKPNQRIPLQLHFTRAGWIAVTATVRPV